MDRTMQYVCPEDLSREEILTKLQQRHLYINDMHVLTHAELVRVYKTFVLPLSKRPSRHKNIGHFHGGYRQDPNKEEDDEMLMANESNVERAPMDIDSSPENDKDVVTSSLIFSPIGEKRRPTDEDFSEDYQYHLSKATKRIRIDAFF